MNSGVLNILAKATGAVGLGLVLYDAHKAGTIKAPMEETAHKSHQLSEHYLDDMKIDKPSVVKKEAKHHIFSFLMDEDISSFFTSAKGYFEGFSSMLVDHVIPFGLSLGALFGGKGIFSKFCGAGLLVYGGMFLAEEIFGVGKAK